MSAPGWSPTPPNEARQSIRRASAGRLLVDISEDIRRAPGGREPEEQGSFRFDLARNFSGLVVTPGVWAQVFEERSRLATLR
jgi:hypothetical protein